MHPTAEGGAIVCFSINNAVGTTAMSKSQSPLRRTEQFIDTWYIRAINTAVSICGPCHYIHVALDRAPKENWYSGVESVYVEKEKKGIIVDLDLCF